MLTPMLLRGGVCETYCVNDMGGWCSPRVWRFGRTGGCATLIMKCRTMMTRAYELRVPLRESFNFRLFAHSLTLAVTRCAGNCTESA